MSTTDSTPITIYLARHATPDWSRKELRYDIPPGPPLVPAGEEEAAKLGEFLRDAGVRKLYTSPLERTRHTAEIAGAVAAIPVQEEAAITEYRREENDPAVLARMLGFVTAVRERGELQEPVALVSHGGTVRVLLEHYGIDQNELAHYRRQFDGNNPLPPAGVWAVTFRNGDTPALELAFSPGAFTAYTSEN